MIDKGSREHSDRIEMSVWSSKNPTLIEISDDLDRALVMGKGVKELCDIICHCMVVVDEACTSLFQGDQEAESITEQSQEIYVDEGIPLHINQPAFPVEGPYSTDLSTA